jgi:hypothetical protein
MPNEFLRRFGIEQCRLGVFVLLRFDNIADVETVAQGSRVAPASRDSLSARSDGLQT